MKRLLTSIALLLTFIASWADSPLTSTHFAEAYSDHEMVQMANEMMQYDMPTTLLNFLADKSQPVDVRLAVINKVGWNFNGTSMGAQLGEYLMGRYNVKTEKKLVKKLDAGTLAVYAYARAMSDYFNVTRRLSLSYRHRIRIDAQTVIEIVSVGVVAEQIFYVIFCILNQLVVHKKHPHRLYHYGGGFVVFSSKEITSLLWQ